MKAVFVALVAISFFGVQFAFGLTSPSTVPAFLWSSHQSSYNGMKEAVNYCTISPKDLAKSVLFEGGWSNILCSGENAQQPPVDIALVFVGKVLETTDISRNKHSDPAFINFLKVPFTRSNFSMAFPYVASSEEKDTMENSLVSGFQEVCGNDFGAKNVAFLDSCSIEGQNFEKLADLHSIHDYVLSKMEKKPGQASMVVACYEGSSSAEEIDQVPSEGEMFSDLISLLEQSGATYSVLYASDPYKSISYPSHRALERFLAQGSIGNDSSNSTACDEICQIKSSLLEGLFVGIVLLIILISGLCCMMGIDTPTRFETPQDS